MSKKIDRIRQLVKSKFEKSDWQYHILPVVIYAKKLAKFYKIDEEITELAALLHDIGRVKLENDGAHHIIGVAEAEKILRKYNYPKSVIEEVKHCVESHRTSKGLKPKTMIAKIVANADAMSHFDILPIFFYWRATTHNPEEIILWVEDKIKNDWQRKITLPKARKMAEKNYKMTMLFLKTLKENNL